ncbi:Protein UmuD [Methylobacterium cerastii]|uniref:Protein UmuD n=1 Tax=Methylobacterium cerastii TaxID=932741 RepID=A0ABQ4QPH5_9HYPH|nr:MULTISPECIES: S24 family peptidase [Methylobacterium]TXN01837.1 translesion error-prone DNA polymerase V autoproteolytic subunit [Methylobacterium sp. WL103]GJD47190.1 Protein UmuD [Methylobacterium cerastii]
MSPYAVDELILGSTDAVRVPVIGQALCAGFPSPADDFLEGALELPRWLVPNPPATFLMQIRGESMRGAGIHDRDLACIDRSLRAEDGSVVVAVVDGQLSCKRYRMVGNRARLDFDNPEMPAFAVDEFGEVEIWGVLRFSIRWHLARGRLS